MNTHDKYELPPLPEARIVSYQTDSTMRSMELRTHSDEDMRDYARTAIEADHQRRGEPVAEVQLHAHDASTTVLRPLVDFEPSDVGKKLYLAPQPAEPVKVLSEGGGK